MAFCGFNGGITWNASSPLNWGSEPYNETWICSPSQLKPVQAIYIQICCMQALFTQQYLSLSLPLSHTFPLAVTPPPNHHSNNYTFFLPFLSYSEWLSHCMLRLPVACGDFGEFVMTAPLPLRRSCLEFPRRIGKGDAREGWARPHARFLVLMGP